jgi:DNA-binding CsgD family transcriptional regulator
MLRAFDESVRAALDIWASDPARPVDKFEDVERFRHLIDVPMMNLQVLDMSFDDPMRYTMSVVVESFDIQRDGADTLGSFPDRQYITQHVLKDYLHAADTGHPKIDRIATRIRDQYVVYDRIILPRKKKRKTEKSEWAVAISLPEINIPAPVAPPKLTGRDHDILNLLVMGNSTKEIAFALDMTPKAVEHRLSALRNQYKAKTLAHLTSIAVVSALAR